MKTSIIIIALLIGFVVGGVALAGTMAMHHGGFGMMGSWHGDHALCLNNDYSD